MEEYHGENENTLQDRYLIFSVGGTSYALEITYVVEIVELMQATPVPYMPNYMTGIINLRGWVIPVMDARARFSYEPCEYTDRACIIVIEDEGVAIGLLVDAVSEVTDIMRDEIVAPPTVENSTSQRFIKGIGRARNEVQLIIDCNDLLEM